MKREIFPRKHQYLLLLIFKSSSQLIQNKIQITQSGPSRTWMVCPPISTQVTFPSMRCSLCFYHSDLLAFPWILYQVLTSGPLHFLFPPSETLFQIFSDLFPFFGQVSAYRPLSHICSFSVLFPNLLFFITLNTIRHFIMFLHFHIMSLSSIRI